jgi:uncharacterized protein (TIGR02444 family)
MTAPGAPELPADTPDEAAFWTFSLAFYGRPGVAAACLALQDEHGLDVNLVLLCCWLGWSGRGRLDAAALAAADRSVAAWRREVIQPLRAVRRALKTHPAAAAAALRRDVQTLELCAEREAQRLLLAGLGGAPAGTDRRADAAANLALYLAAGGADVTADATAAATLIEALHNFD